MFNAQKTETLSDIGLENVEALASYEGTTSCLDPYDVKDHQLDYKPYTGTFSVDMFGEITIAGKKFSVGGTSAGTTIQLTYLLGDCRMESPGNCCPASKNGDVKIVGM